VNVLQINKEDTQELGVVCVSLGAVAERGALQGPPTYITLKEDLHAEKHGKGTVAVPMLKILRKAVFI
jgi:hypothetical protein